MADALLDDLDRLASSKEFINKNGFNPVWEVRFYSKPVKSTPSEVARGIPLYRDVDYIYMVQRGAHIPYTVYDREVDFVGVTHVSDSAAYRLPDPERFPFEWDLYKNQSAKKDNGTNIELADFLTKSDVLNYRSKNIDTIEQLSMLGQHAISQIGGAVEKHIKLAKELLDKNKSLELVTLVSEENRNIKEANELLAKQLEDIRKQLIDMQNNSSDDLVQTRKRKTNLEKAE